MTVADLLGYSLDSPQIATLPQRPSPCVCKPLVGVPFSRAFVDIQKAGYPPYTGDGSRRFRKKTYAWSYSETSTGAWHPLNWTKTGSASVTVEIIPGVGEKIISVTGSATHSGYYGETSIGDPSAGYESATFTLTAGADPFAWPTWVRSGFVGVVFPSDFIDVRTSLESAISYDHSSEGLTDTRVVTITEFQRTVVDSYDSSPRDYSSSTGTVTIDEESEDTDETLSERAALLLDEAAALTSDVRWYPGGPPSGGYRVSASNGRLSESAADAAVTACTAEVAAKEAALAAIPSEKTYDRHVAQNRLDYAELALAIAEHNQAEVENTTDPILFTLSEDGDPAESYRVPSEDMLSLAICSVRFLLASQVASTWDYEENPIPHKFRWREASWADGDASPAFTAEDATTSNPVTLQQLFGSTPYLTSYAVMDTPSVLSCPAMPGRKALANPTPEGEESAPYLGQWTVLNTRSAGMQKLGFQSHTPGGSVPVIYRRETATGALSGFHEYREVETFNEDEPESPPYVSYEYSDEAFRPGEEELPEGFDVSKLSPWSGDPTPHSRHWPVSGRIASATVRVFGASPDEITMTLSLPWETSEIVDSIDAHVDASWPAPPDYTQPPNYPDTGIVLPNASLPFALRWLAASETSYMRQRSRYSPSVAAPYSAGYHPDFADGMEIEWTWKKSTHNLATGEVTVEDLSESMAYGANSRDLAESPPEPRELDTADPATRVWLSRPTTDNPWFWTDPECRPICEI